MVRIRFALRRIRALTSILAKIGIDGVNSNLATALRTVVVPTPPELDVYSLS